MSATTRRLRLGPLPKTETVKITFTCTVVLKAELERYAVKHRVRTVTFLVPMDNNRALKQVKAWGFEEFRIMPDGPRLLAFYRKRLA